MWALCDYLTLQSSAKKKGRAKGKVRAKGKGKEKESDDEDEVDEEGRKEKNFNFRPYVQHYFDFSGFIDAIPEDFYVDLCTFYFEYLKNHPPPPLPEFAPALKPEDTIKPPEPGKFEGKKFFNPLVFGLS